ncbi:MAG: GGDEF domain-containing protein [Xanthomonadales bacterium PRO6]|nr:hypothetical protein [Xanthomonadales bacterium]MCE7932216.1 GGDEF domain-containing protein [Xanthomonadales bacterium PRO6]
MRALAGLALCLASMSSLAGDDIDRRLARAEEVKRTALAEFDGELDAIAGAPLDARQREHYNYLRSWQSTYVGEYETAIAGFRDLIERGQDPVLRFRSRVTLLNALTLSRRYPDSFEQLNLVLAELDGIADQAAQAQALGAAAQLLNQVAQYTDSLEYSGRLMRMGGMPWARCGAAQLQYEARVKSGRQREIDDELQRWADDCAAGGEQVFAGLLRTYIARLHLANGRPGDAIDSLARHRDAIQATRYPFLLADVAATLASAYLALGNDAAATASAEEAIAATQEGEYTQALSEAWKVVAQAAERRGEPFRALRALERHQAVDRAWLDDVGQRALAFQMARHQARQKSLEIENLERQNEVLQLQQRVNEETVQSARLSILLLVSVLGFAIAWALRTRRLKQHFQDLAQRDTLTQLATRPYFMAEATRLIEQARRTRQPVAMVLLDLDWFKSINDRYGHAAGDEVLRRASAICREVFAAAGLVGRIGGEEFAALLPGYDLAAAATLAEHCRAALRSVGYGPEQAREQLSGSFGVASNEGSGYELRQLLSDSDAAMYLAKNSERNRVVRHTPTTPAKGDSRAAFA